MPTVTRVRVLVQGFERDGAVDSHAARATPGDALIPNLLGDLGLPLVPLAGEVRDPEQVGIVDLTNFLHALHEVRERREQRPLAVRSAYRRVNLDRFLDGGHWLVLPLVALDAVPGVSRSKRSRGRDSIHVRGWAATGDRPETFARWPYPC